jgi:integrase
MAKKGSNKPLSEISGLRTTLGLFDLSDFVVDHFKSIIPEKELIKDSENFIMEHQALQSKVNEYFGSISNVLFLSTFLVWVKDPRNAMSTKIRELVKRLFIDKFIIFEDEDHNLLILEQILSNDLTKTIDEIRCRPEVSISDKENLVELYIIFTMWLQSFTYGYIHTIEDPDKVKSRGRTLSLSQFNQLLERLDQKGQLVGKLLYFGGSRTLDEVLDLKLEDVNFKKSLIRYGSQLVSYPEHVFSDIKVLTDSRKKGRVFLGRQEAPLNRATIFRTFKEAGSLSGLGDSFSPKALTTSS